MLVEKSQPQRDHAQSLSTTDLEAPIFTFCLCILQGAEESLSEWSPEGYVLLTQAQSWEGFHSLRLNWMTTPSSGDQMRCGVCTENAPHSVSHLNIYGLETTPIRGDYSR